jgi:hypothetical protein
MPNVLALGDLERVLTRAGGWIAGAVAASPAPTTATFAVTGYDLSAAPSLAGALCVVGKLGQRQVATIASNSGSTLTLQTALGTTPAVGAPVVIYPANVTVTANENINEVGGVSLPTGETGNPALPIFLAGAVIQLPTNLQSSRQGTLDSTTTALAASGTYTTASAVSCAVYRRIVGSVYCDQDGTLNVQQSPDGTDWDVTSTFTVTGGTGQGFSVEVVAPYMRLDYVNGTTAQTTFRLYAWGTPNS